MSESNEDVVLSIFWCGTAGTIREHTTQIADFFSTAIGTDISRGMVFNDDKERQYKMAIDGVGRTHGMCGTLWACGLEEQCEAVVSRVERLMDGPAATTRLRLNCLGLSRGACGILRLCVRLSHFDSSRLLVSALLFDPVPGNLVLCGTANPLALASTARRVDQCRVLRRVLAIYPYEPLPDCVLHAPLIAIYPPDCAVDEDVTLGCHQGALFRKTYDLACFLSHCRIRRFMLECGTRFRHAATIADEEREALSRVERWVRAHHRQGDEATSTRMCHGGGGWGRCFVTRRMLKREAEEGDIVFLNRHHAQLDARQKGKERSGASYILRLEKRGDFALPEPCCVACVGFVVGLVVVLVVLVVVEH